MNSRLAELRKKMLGKKCSFVVGTNKVFCFIHPQDLIEARLGVGKEIKREIAYWVGEEKKWHVTKGDI